MKRAPAPLVIAMIVMLTASACLVTLPAPGSISPTLTPDIVSTGKAQTLMAAPTSTFTVTVPPDTTTPTNTLTSFPTITPLPTATATFTEPPFGFVASPTLGTPDLTPGEATPDPADGATDDWGADYRCNLVDKNPATGTILPPKSIYKVAWTLQNTGKKKWQAGDIVLIYIDGPKMSAEEKAFNLNKDVKVNSSIKLLLDIVAPKDSGNQRSVWGLQIARTKHVFCTFTVNIIVQ